MHSRHISWRILACLGFILDTAKGLFCIIPKVYDKKKVAVRKRTVVIQGDENSSELDILGPGDSFKANETDMFQEPDANTPKKAVI